MKMERIVDRFVDAPVRKNLTNASIRGLMDLFLRERRCLWESREGGTGRIVDVPRWYPAGNIQTFLFLGENHDRLR